MSINPYLKEVGLFDNVHDYAHADRVFRTDAFRLHPRFSFLYYVRINLDPTYTMMAGTAQKEIGALVKSVSLPKFTIDTKTLNAYNRVNVVQTKIKYDPVTIKFHDDAADVIRKFWYDYYSYYYRDSDHATSLYQQAHKYKERPTDEWGYGLRGNKAANSDVTNLIRDIQIFTFQGKQFSEVTLHNPIITAFRHGEHDYARGAELLEHEMTVAFETVTYGSGFFTTDAFSADMLLKYDRNPSPLSPTNVGGVPGTDLAYKDGQVVRATGATNVYRDGSTDAPSNASGIPAAGGPKTKKSNSIFATAGKAILGGMISSAIRGRNPLSAFSAQNASSLLYQAGSAVGGPLGQKIIASGGLLRAGQSIMRNGVGPGNFGTLAVAVRSAGALGIRPDSLISGAKKIFSNKATTNGAAVAQTTPSSYYGSQSKFPPVTNAPTSNSGSSSYYSNPAFTDGRPNVMNGSENLTPPSNQGRPGNFTI